MQAEAGRFKTRNRGRNAVVDKLRQAAALALDHLATLRAAESLSAAALRAEVGHISDQMLERYGCELNMRDATDGCGSRFTIHLRDADCTYDLIADFYHYHSGSEK